MFKKILVPVDGSAVAEAVLPRVTELAKALNAEVTVLRVAGAHVFPGVDPTEAEVQVVREAEAYVEALAGQLSRQGLAARAVVRYGHPAAEIVGHAARDKVDLVAMSTHGRSGLNRLLMGSVAEAVVRNASTPVLLVRGPWGHMDTP